MIILNCLNKEEVRLLNVEGGEASTSCVNDGEELPDWVRKSLKGAPSGGLPIPKLVPAAGNLKQTLISRSGKFELGRHFFLAKWGLMSGDPTLSDKGTKGRRVYKLTEHEKLIEGVRFSRCAEEGGLCQCPGRGASRVAFVRPTSDDDEDVFGNITPTPVRGVFDTDSTPMRELPGELKCEPFVFGVSKNQPQLRKGHCLCDTSAVDVILPLKPELQLKASIFLESAGGEQSAFGPFDGRVTEVGLKQLHKYLSSRGAGRTASRGHVAQTMRYAPSNASFHPGNRVVVLRRLVKEKRSRVVGTVGEKGCRFESTVPEDPAKKVLDPAPIDDEIAAGPFLGLPGKFGEKQVGAAHLGKKRRAVTIVERCYVEIGGRGAGDVVVPAWDLASAKMNFRVYYAPTGQSHKVARIIKIYHDRNEVELFLESTAEIKTNVPVGDLLPLIDSHSLLEVFQEMANKVVGAVDFVQAHQAQQEAREAAAEYQARQNAARKAAAERILSSPDGASASTESPEVDPDDLNFQLRRMEQLAQEGNKTVEEIARAESGAGAEKGQKNRNLTVEDPATAAQVYLDILDRTAQYMTTPATDKVWISSLVVVI